MSRPLLVVVALALSGCVGPPPEAPAAVPPPAAPPPSSPTAAPSPAPPPEEPAAAPAPPAPVAPSLPTPAAPVGPYSFASGMAGGAFLHERLDAFPQATIAWTNADVLTHSVVSSDGRFAGSGPLAPGMSFAATFGAPGEYPFHCRYHAGMAGVVVVA